MSWCFWVDRTAQPSCANAYWHVAHACTHCDALMCTRIGALCHCARVTLHCVLRSRALADAQHCSLVDSPSAPIDRAAHPPRVACMPMFCAWRSTHVAMCTGAYCASPSDVLHTRGHACRDGLLATVRKRRACVCLVMRASWREGWVGGRSS